MKRIRRSLFLIVLLSSCGSGSNISAEKAINLSDNYVNQQYPMAPREILRPAVRDGGRTWVVTYEAPEGSAGGTPTVEVDKQTGNIVRSSHDQ